MGKVIVIEKRCKGCQLCIPVCPKGLLTMGQKFNAAGYHIVSFHGEADANRRLIAIIKTSWTYLKVS